MNRIGPKSALLIFPSNEHLKVYSPSMNIKVQGELDVCSIHTSNVLFTIHIDINTKIIVEKYLKILY